MFKTFFFLTYFILGQAVFADDIQTDAVMNALTKELNRSFKEFKNAEKVPLYFLGYEIIEAKSYYLGSKMGAMDGDSDYTNRKLDIEMRVNNPEMDNTHQVKGESAWTNYAQSQNLPVAVDENEDALQARIWEYTDKAFKKAQANFTKVQMNKAVTAQEEDASPDFAPAKPEQFYETVTLPAMDKKVWKERLNKFSAKFKDYPFIYDSGVSFSAKTENRWIVNSEGTRVKTGNNYITLAFSLMSRTTDGMELQRGERYNGAEYAEMPSDEKVLTDIDKAITELKALRTAPIVEPFHGPAILKGRAAGVYFHEIIGHRLEGHRQKLEDEGQTFSKKIGQKVTSDIITLYDDPNLKDYKGRSLRGYYKYDDEGVKAQRATLIENGVLKGFLMNRSPISNFPESNGHGRRSSGRATVSRMGNTMVEASKTVSYAELRQMLIDECKKQGKPFGLVFDDISGGFTNIGRGGPQAFKVLPLLVYRIYTDGRPDEVVRGVDIVGTPLTSLSKVTAAADDTDIFNGTCGAESGWVPVSCVSPSLLITEMEVEKSQKSQEKPPVLEPPLHDKQ